MNVHLDTHVAVWLASGEQRRLKSVRARLNRGSIFVSPIVLVEMEVLREIGRISRPIAEVWQILNEDHEVEEAPGDLREVGRHARSLSWTRDPFDQLIVAHALATDAILLTADGTIREHCPQARWGR